ncbi:ABC transporter permease family protein [Streptomyces justiciae]|uniref:hypothetical protein n=1 Tax=Streptomyces justiciae TaxID=2780140 RepID=UPI001D141EF5|nr:hypothetical protein [Streptomyces justiciae]MCW8375970.1 hypothetical protein [Streptomyces justiciae]
MIWPDGLTLSAYREMLSDPTVRTSVLVSLGITAVGTAISMVVSVLCAYGLSRARSHGHRLGDWRIPWSVVLPTSRAVTAVITLFYAVGYWNAFFNVMLYMPTESQKWPLQYVLLTYVNRGNGLPGSVNSGFGNAHAETAPLSLQMAVVVLTLVPLLVVYPFMQKHFRTGVLTGAVKG